MPISQQEAQGLLNCLEDSKKKPELILSDLFIHGVSGMNLLYQIYLDGEYICDYCKRQLLTLEVFQDCVIEQNSFEFTVYLRSKYKDGYLNDRIMKIDASKKTIAPQDEAIKVYRMLWTNHYRRNRKKKMYLNGGRNLKTSLRSEDQSWPYRYSVSYRETFFRRSGTVCICFTYL